MRKNYKFRLYPSREEERKLFRVLDRCRFVYNKLLEGLNKQEKKDRGELQHSIVDLKKQFPELKGVYSKVLQYENQRLFSNLKSLAALKRNGRRVGRLRFKGREWFKTFTYNQSGFKLVKTGKRCCSLCLSKIGDVRIRVHRRVKGKIKQVTVKRYASGKWYALLSCEREEVVVKKQGGKAVGIDLGVINFIYDSEGNRVDHPMFLKNSLKKLGKEQRRFSKRKKGSKNRRRQRVRVARVHERVTSQRGDFLHKLSRWYVVSFGFIGVEKLNIKGLVGESYNPRNILDASWGKFIRLLRYKAGRAGCRFVRVDPRGTSQNCSWCGKMVRKSLSVRTHKCSHCGFKIDRDYNSAINVLKRALGQGVSEFTPVEIGPLPFGASLVVEAGTIRGESLSPNINLISASPLCGEGQQTLEALPF